MALKNDVEMINDISGLKYDKNMKNVISKYNPSLILCSYSKKLCKRKFNICNKTTFESKHKDCKNAQISKKNCRWILRLDFLEKLLMLKTIFYTKSNLIGLNEILKLSKILILLKMYFSYFDFISNKSLFGSLLTKRRSF